MQPIIKWTGSKRHQADEIIKHFPRNINVYHECFVGGGSVLHRFLEGLECGEINSVSRIVCSDINYELICLWNLIKNNPSYLFDGYKEFHSKFSVADDNTKKMIFGELRSKFNSMRSNLSSSDENLKDEFALCFFCLTRTAFNGLVRYNKNGDYSTSCHFSRNGIEPSKLLPILNDWNSLLNKYNVEFICGSYNQVIEPKDVSDEDFIYLDPPYGQSKGMYNFAPFDDNDFYEWMSALPCPYILSYDGTANDIDNTQDVPRILYDEHIYLKSGNSSFRRLKNMKDIEVYESLYLKGCPSVEENEKQKLEPTQHKLF